MTERHSYFRDLFESGKIIVIDDQDDVLKPKVFNNGLITNCCVCGGEVLVRREDRVEQSPGVECAYTCAVCQEFIDNACTWCGGFGHKREDCEQFNRAMEGWVY